MKLVVGMGSIDDYIPFVKAGADEIFCGFVPDRWQQQYGLNVPLNRREVCHYNVQIGSLQELRILKDMMDHYKVPVTLTFNSLNYRPDLFPVIAEILSDVRNEGFRSVILADPALLLYLYRQGLTREFNIHISGDMGELNRFSAQMYLDLGADRLIFHRKMTFDDMDGIISHLEKNDPGRNFDREAFFLNEMCHFHGGYCNALHCDELMPICREYYEVGPLEEGILPLPEISAPETIPPEGYLTGRGGCGLCALPDLKQVGVTHLKIVGRGAAGEDIIRDIRAAKQALAILDTNPDPRIYQREMKKALFPGGCSDCCYYRT